MIAIFMLNLKTFLSPLENIDQKVCINLKPKASRASLVKITFWENHSFITLISFPQILSFHFVYCFSVLTLLTLIVIR